MPPPSADANLQDYYARRANEYERIYAKPERQEDLARLQEILPSLLDGRDVLEIACGTGYWTQFVASRADRILATDINDDVLELARRKVFPRGNVAFLRFDIYSGRPLPRSFDAGFAAFWWSHVPREGIERFLACFHRRLGSDATALLVDNRYVEGSSTPLSRIDDEGNTYQMRTLDDGSTYEVLKNIPDEAELVSVLGRAADTLEYRETDYFWYATYRTP